MCPCVSFSSLFSYTHIGEWETKETSTEKPHCRWLSACWRSCFMSHFRKRSATVMMPIGVSHGQQEHMLSVHPITKYTAWRKYRSRLPSQRGVFSVDSFYRICSFFCEPDLYSASDYSITQRGGWLKVTFTVHLKEYGVVMCLPFLLLQRATAQHLFVINPLLFPIDVSQGYKNSLRVYRRICAHAFPFSPYSHISLYREWETSETSNVKPHYRWISACWRFCCRCSDGKQSATKISFDLFPMFPLRWSYIWCWDAQPRVRILPVEVPEQRSYPRAYYEHPRFRK